MISFISFYLTMIKTIVNLDESCTHINESIDLVSLEIQPLARIIIIY